MSLSLLSLALSVHMCPRRRRAHRSAGPAEGPCLKSIRGGEGDDAAALDTLNIEEHKVDTRRVRQHVNPLSGKYQQPTERPEGWMAQAYGSPGNPVHVDIGCARGRFCMGYAAKNPDLNVLGLEIRAPLVAGANRERREAGLENAFFLFTNANVDIGDICGEVRASGTHIASISVQFPDPHFKKRNHKRRVVQKDLVDTVVENLQDGGFVFLQGDIFEVVVEMRRRFAEHPLLEDTMFSKDDLNAWVTLEPEDLDATDMSRWIPENPLGVPTEREQLVTSEGGSIYRCLFRKQPAA